MRTPRSAARAIIAGVLYFLSCTFADAQFFTVTVKSIKSSRQSDRAIESVESGSSSIPNRSYTIVGEGVSSSLTDLNRQLGISIEYRTLGNTAEPAVIDWFFVARDVNTKDRWIFDAGRMRVREVAAFEVYSKVLLAQDNRHTHYTLETRVVTPSGDAAAGGGVGNPYNRVTVERRGTGTCRAQSGSRIQA